MAKIKPVSLIEALHGKLTHKGDVVFRTRGGETHSYTIKHPYQGPLAESRKVAINVFSEASRRCSEQINDPERLSFWQKEYDHYKRRTKRRIFGQEEKHYSTLRGFMMAKIAAQIKEENKQ